MFAKQMLWVLAVMAVGMVCWAGSARAELMKPFNDGNSTPGFGGYVLKVSSWWDQGPSYLFDEPGITYGASANTDACYSDGTGDVSPIIWMDFGSEFIFTALGYANRTGSNIGDRTTSLKVWISDTLSGYNPTVANPPSGTPDETFVTSGGTNFDKYDFIAGPYTSRYVVVQFIAASNTTADHYHPGGSELRLDGTPEPATMALLGLGGLGVLLNRKRR